MPVTGKLTISHIDYDGEVSNSFAHVTVLSAANFDAQATLRTNYVAAVEAIVLGNLQKTEYGNMSLQSNSASDDQDAQRELKWLVSYHDTTSLKRYSLEIGTADVAQLDPNDRAHANIGDAGVVDAFVTAFEAYVLSPTGGAVSVDEITLVGRPV